MFVCRVSREDYSSFLPQEPYVKVSLHTARVFSNPFCIRHQLFCITDFVILDNSPLTLMSVSLSPIGVFEYLTLVSLFPFTQENTICKSASFRIRAKFEPLSNPLKIGIRFLLNPLPSLSLLLLTKFLPF
ncbi:predicted protein [Methanosarcina acetivorans C2A]|uniref:Uncharacterized protein n=1 Tax=Methanosarcina acetivorans (strain ATCC 35395 / DSM 2834 / JCM 12185 / C2A) TaxID=188937 RepID=Q8TJ40_METAC|nr:predicted protein [Methanosarcina acetivorans C2A]